MGQSTAVVPDVYGKTESQAVSELKAMEFKVTVTEMASDEVELGRIIKTEPSRNSSVAKGSEITVFKSTGKPTRYVKVPNLIGLTKEKAVSDINEAGLNYKINDVDVSQDDKYYAKGFVISQSPDANSSGEVVEGTVITINVSTGNYKFDLSVDLPNDCKYESGKVSIWVGNKLFAESELIKINDIMNYTFKGLVSSDKRLNAQIQFTNDGKNYDLYEDIVINCEKGSYTVQKISDGYKETFD